MKLIFFSFSSASLKSIDVSIRSGSITSISSGKSFVSNFSVKSDSGISLPAKPATKHNFVQELPKVQENQQIQSSTFRSSSTDSSHTSNNSTTTSIPTIPKIPKSKLGRRSWESEPMLPTLHRSSKKKSKKDGGSLTERTNSKVSLSSMGEKEKSRAMQRLA